MLHALQLPVGPLAAVCLQRQSSLLLMSCCLEVSNACAHMFMQKRELLALTLARSVHGVALFRREKSGAVWSGSHYRDLARKGLRVLHERVAAAAHLNASLVRLERLRSYLLEVVLERCLLAELRVAVFRQASSVCIPLVPTALSRHFEAQLLTLKIIPAAPHTRQRC